MTHISDSDLGSLRRLVARDRAIEVHPSDYTRQEREDHYLDYMITMGRLFAVYGIDETMGIDPNTGAVSEMRIGD